jgi:hypothetical protein
MPSKRPSIFCSMLRRTLMLAGIHAPGTRV